MLRDKLDNLMVRVSEIQQINLYEDGVSFAKEGFTDLHDLIKEIYLLDAENLIKAEKRGMAKGILIGGLVVGAGTYGYRKLKTIISEIKEEMVEEQGE